MPIIILVRRLQSKRESWILKLALLFAIGSEFGSTDIQSITHSNLYVTNKMENHICTPQRSHLVTDNKDIDYNIPSPCPTSTSSSPSVSRSIDYSYMSGSYTPRNGKTTTRYQGDYHSYSPELIIPPSPARTTLDPQYAKRLFGRNHGSTLTSSQHIHSTVNSSAGFSTPVSSFHTTDGAAKDTDANTSNSSVFHTPDRSMSSQQYGNKHAFETPSTVHSGNGDSQYLSPEHSPRDVSSFSYSSHNIMSSTKRRIQFNFNNTTSNTRRGSGIEYSDRFIPSRSSSKMDFSVWNEDKHERNRSTDEQGVDTTRSGTDVGNEADLDSSRQDSSSSSNQGNSQQLPLMDILLRTELLGENIDPCPQSSNIGTGTNFPGATMSTNRTPLKEGGNFFHFHQNSRQDFLDAMYGDGNDPTSIVNSFGLSPVGSVSSHRLLSLPQKRKRRISKVPFKVLDAPALADDFYLNLVDWSSLNVLAVGLGSCVYLWSACTSKVTKLCDLGTQSQDAVTSVAWTQRGTHLAVGVNNGEVQIWDSVKCKKVRTMGGHSARIGALSWSGPILASGSRDRLIYLRDVRLQQPFTARLASHKQEVCGLKWSFDEPAHLASGGNDNKLLVWDIKNHRQPAHRFAEHTAAVKAIAWSPHQHGLLASGGGTADRCIRFWNALSGSPLNAIDTGSQVCNLAWSQNCNEIVSTHGYSLNQIALWKYPSMQKVATLTGHTYRVLYLAMSPDGSTIVTGAGDETLRFWQVFPGPRSHDKSAGNGLLFPSCPGSVLR